MKKRIIAVVLAVVLVTGGLGSVAYAQVLVNEVEARFTTDLNYGPWPDTFTNGDEISLSWENWEAKMGNSPDGTGANVTALTLSLDSGVPFNEVSNGNLVTLEPPTYEWFFGDIPQGSGEEQAKARVGLVGKEYSPPITYTPGFDASRSVDKAEFFQSDGTQQTQVLTVTVTPRQRTELEIGLGADENDLISPLIISAISGDGVAYPTDGHRVNICPITGLEPNTTWTLTVTFLVTPKKPKVKFIPYVEVGWNETIASGTTSGSSVSYPAGDPVDEAGTWTWRAEGSYEWHWIQELRPAVHWFTRCREIVNIPPVAQASVDPYLAPVGSEFTFDGSASSDEDGTIVSYDWDFGDGTSDSGVSVTHAYAAPGLYDVVLTVTDDMGAQATDSVMATVYDPAAGFATGGGWLIPGGKTSYKDDYLPDIDGTSPANFGFVVKYKPGATNPDGQLEFQYRQGDFNLHSSGMDWLVVTNNNWAKFQGMATIKGLDGLFPFRVDAKDGDFGGGDQPDRFIIKIWAPGADPDQDELIYKASGDLEGGSIVIQRQKVDRF